jgi:hypothetical protein
MRPLPEPELNRGALALPAPAGTARRTRERRALSRGRAALMEGWLLLGGTFAVFAALGIWLTVDLKVVAYDGAFRLAHAYFAWYGAPPKLAAIGFVWPPVMTLVFLPFALVRPLSTSLAALPLTSALAAAGTLVVLNRLLEHCELRRFARYPLLLAFAANPMFVHYATNGMSEMLTFFWLVLGVHQFLRWERTGQSAFLALSGAALALGVLSRYELLPYAAAVALAIALMARSRRQPPQVIEGSLLLFAAPVLYGLMTWMLFNYLVVGDPLSFLHQEVAQRIVAEKGRSAAQGGAGGVSISDLGALASAIASLYWRLFAPQVLVLGPLIALSVLRRSGIGLTIAALILLNPIMTALLVKGSDVSLLQLRFNMRSMPLVIVAIGWIFWLTRTRWARSLIALSAVAGMVACIPLSWQTMKTYPYVFADRDFVHAVQTGRPHDTVGIGDAKAMASYVHAHVHGIRQVLVDDAQTFLPLLVGGHPELFFNRIDKGDAVWTRVRDAPRGRVGFMLVPRRQGPLPDLILLRYPGAPAGRVPFLRPVFSVGNMTLLAVSPPLPPPTAPRPSSTGPAPPGH